MVGARPSAKAMTSSASARSSWIPKGKERQRVRLQPPPGDRGKGTDLWEGILTPASTGNWSFVIEAWHDRYGTWHHNAEVKVEAGIDVELMLAEGAALLSQAAEDPARPSDDRRTLRMAAAVLSDTSLSAEERLAAGFSEDVAAVVEREPIRELVTVSEAVSAAGRAGPRRPRLPGTNSFPRSEGAVRDHSTGEWTSGNFRTAAKRLDAVAGMGFDVIYMPPIHPIGVQHRKGPNNTLIAGPHDPGSPWAIGVEGGRPRRHPPGPRNLRGLRRLRGAGQRAGPGSGPGPGAAGRPGPPLGADESGVVHHPGGRQHRLRREPAEEVPGHLPRSTSTTIPRACPRKSCASSSSGSATA